MFIAIFSFIQRITALTNNLVSQSDPSNILAYLYLEGLNKGRRLILGVGPGLCTGEEVRCTRHVSATRYEDGTNESRRW